MQGVGRAVLALIDQCSLSPTLSLFILLSLSCLFLLGSLLTYWLLFLLIGLPLLYRDSHHCVCVSFYFEINNTYRKLQKQYRKGFMYPSPSFCHHCDFFYRQKDLRPHNENISFFETLAFRKISTQIPLTTQRTHHTQVTTVFPLAKTEDRLPSWVRWSKDTPLCLSY